MNSIRSDSGYWFELGAHTCYNSYGALLELIEASGQMENLVPRGKPVLRFLDGDQPVRGKNLGLLVKLFGKLEILCALPKWFAAKPSGLSVRDYYSRLVGPRNYARVLGPMLSAVPSQCADDFPSDMLFKKRERRKDVMRSFTVEGGLNAIVEALVAHENIEVRTACTANQVTRLPDGFRVELDDGSSVETGLLALAVPPNAVARLLSEASLDLAEQARKLDTVEVDSLGFSVDADRSNLPYATFFIPLADCFYSAVTRDVVPDPNRRAFAFHFRPGLTREERLARAETVVGVKRTDMSDLQERRITLPSPTIGHEQVVREIDSLLKGDSLAITGNWFAGLSIEDCALRSQSEWTRVGG